MAEEEFVDLGQGRWRLSPQPPETGNGIARLLGLWFGFHRDVGRREYAVSGFGLMLLKYATEAAVLWFAVDASYTPLDFVNPSAQGRSQMLLGAADWVGWAWILWTLPFMWIAVSMSVRRAANAGWSPWAGMLVLVPVVNLIVMLTLAALPGTAHSSQTVRRETVSTLHGVRSAVLGVGIGLLLAAGMVAVGIYGFDTYGASIFLGTPVVMGAVSSAIFNWGATRSLGASITIGVFTVVIAGAALLLFGLEGVICLAMAAPIAIPLGGLGGAMGMAIAAASSRRAPGTFLAIAVLPIWSGVESATLTPQQCLVVSHVDIDAPPERVWKYVVEFPDLPEPEEWYFRSGIACPMRAHIDGRGVGAVRRCIFTTGVFVEPITVWDEPRSLAFDVTQQPAPMFELSPYHHVHPPHLDGVMRSNRGEFRLSPLPDGRTRLEGLTWYELDMAPQPYWTLWSDLLIHRIHDRVLRHIKQWAEAE